MAQQAAVDSNVLVAIIDSRDKWHGAAQALLTALQFDEVSLIYLDCVVNETVSVLARRAEEQARSDEVTLLLEMLSRHVSRDRITWVPAETERLYEDILELVRQTAGALNFHDALLALSCRELDIRVLVSFDVDFDQIAWLARLTDPDEVRQAFS